jgi:hypothetical protein
MVVEEWRDILGYEGLYKVSSLGRVYSCTKKVIRKFHVVNTGYYMVDLNKNGARKKFYVHRLVATQFLENSDNKPNVNHKDLSRTNNEVTNLEWCTFSENAVHAIENGAVPMGSNRRSSKLNEEQVLEIKELLCRRVKQGDIARRFNISEPTISEIKTGKYWKHI